MLTAQDLEVRNSNVVNEETVAPRRGFPDFVPYLKSGNKLIGMHIATILNPPVEVKKMPIVTMVDLAWPNFSEDDILYDITSWFPLHEMRSEKNAGDEEERWVYYNQTNGYIIANADHFLQSSLYNFVKESILKQEIRNQLSVSYIEVDESVPLNKKAIDASGYRMLMKFSSNVSLGELIRYSNKSQSCESRVDFGRDHTAYVRLSLWSAGFFDLQLDLHLKRNMEQIHDCGMSTSGKRLVLVVNLESVNLLGEVLYFPINTENHYDFELLSIDDEALLQQPNLKFYAAYAVPSDTVNLLGGFSDVDDPFNDGVKVPEKYQGITVDISDLFEDQGVAVKAVFDKMVSTLFVYGDINSHDQIKELFSFIGQGPPKGYKVKIGFYEDLPSKMLEMDSAEEILRIKANKLVGIGSLSLIGHRSRIARGNNVCEVESSYGNREDEVILYLKFDLKLPNFVLEKKMELNSTFDVPKVVKVMTKKNGKSIWMVINVSRSIEHDF